MLSTLILTYNEERHIERCILSAKGISDEILIIDSFSTDKTKEIAESLGAVVYQHEWPGCQAEQLNWALKEIPIKGDWILRLDADEYLLPELSAEISEKLPKIGPEKLGINLKRRVFFMDKWIKRGGYYPIYITRIWRNGTAFFDHKLMDEHLNIKQSETVSFENDFIDHNLQNITWWTDKHNNYATREAAEYLSKKYNLMESFQPSSISETNPSYNRLWFKDKFYTKIPLFLRPVIYFIYRYILLLGFLDGKQGLIWHLLQGFWYRFLVDVKIYQIEKYAKNSGKNMKECVEQELGFQLYQSKISS